jgi:hypothetical protein
MLTTRSPTLANPPFHQEADGSELEAPLAPGEGAEAEVIVGGLLGFDASDAASIKCSSGGTPGLPN